MNEMTFTEFSQAYCERQQLEPDELKETLEKQKANYNPKGWMLLECGIMDSSSFGRRTILVYGPNNTFKEVPDHPISPDGLASTTSTVIGILPVEKLGE